MPRNGSGTFNLVAGNPVVTGTTISSTTTNNTLTDIANGLTGSVSADGQTVMTGNQSMGGFKLTSLGNGTSSSDAVNYAQLLAIVLPSGSMIDFAGTVAPSGFLTCDGSAVSRVTYAALFTAIGTTWGAGDGSTTFNVPDTRRRTTIGSGGTAIAGPANTVGAVGGEETHVLITAELAAHNHGVSDPSHTHANSLTDPTHSHLWGNNAQQSAGAGAGNLGGSGTGTASVTSSSATGITINNAAQTTGITVLNSGSGTAHNNMQPSAVVLKCIKT